MGAKELVSCMIVNFRQYIVTGKGQWGQLQQNEDMASTARFCSQSFLIFFFRNMGDATWFHSFFSHLWFEWNSGSRSEAWRVTKLQYRFKRISQRDRLREPVSRLLNSIISKRLILYMIISYKCLNSWPKGLRFNRGFTNGEELLSRYISYGIDLGLESRNGSGLGALKGSGCEVMLPT